MLRRKAPNALLRHISMVACLVGFFWHSHQATCQDPTIIEPVNDARRLVRLGFAVNTVSGADPRDFKYGVQVMLDRLIEEHFSNLKVKTEVFPDLQTTFRMIQTQGVDFLYLTTLDYLRIRDQVHLEPVMTTSTGQEATDRYVLITSRQKPFRDLADLRNARLRIERGGTGDIARLWLESRVKASGLLSAETLFQRIQTVDKASHAVLPVFFGQADACVVSRAAFETVVELNPQLGEQLFVLAESPGYLSTLVCAVQEIESLPTEVIFGFSEFLENDDEGKQLLLLIRSDRLLRFRPEYLESMEALYTRCTPPPFEAKP